MPNPPEQPTAARRGGLRLACGAGTPVEQAPSEDPPAEQGPPEYASVQQLRDWKSEAEDKMDSLKDQIDSVSRRLGSVEDAFSPPSASQCLAPLRVPGDRRDTMNSITSKATRVTFAGEDTPRDEGEGSSEATPRPMPLQRREKKSICSSILSDMGIESQRSEVYDQWNGEPPATDDLRYAATLSKEREGELMRLVGSGQSGRARACTIFDQEKHAGKLSLSIKLSGIALAFITIVFLWETMDLLMINMFPKKELCLIGYLILCVVAAGALVASHEWVMYSASTEGISSLMPSFAYALSTLYLAIGTWGIVSSSIDVLIPKKKKFFVYAIGGVFTLIATIFYGFQTRHNVLLDIASCATTMGLHGDIDDLVTPRVSSVSV